MDNETFIALTADIVSAHVSNNTVQSDEIAGLIESVYSALANAGAPVQEVEPQEPAVSIRSSVKPDAITCLECGKKMKMLKRHLTTDHSLSADEYRAKWSLPSDYPLVAPEYAARRAELAKKIGLGRIPGAGRKKKSVGKSVSTRSVSEEKKASPAPAENA